MARSQRFRGVRQRHWGSWVSEIRHPLLKTRVWLGTFESAEEAAKAYDEAARLMSGPQAKTNFPYDPKAPLPSTSLLSSMLKAKIQRCFLMSLPEQAAPSAPSASKNAKPGLSLTCLRLDTEKSNLGIWQKKGGRDSKSNWVVKLQLDNDEHHAPSSSHFRSSTTLDRKPGDTESEDLIASQMIEELLGSDSASTKLLSPSCSSHTSSTSSHSGLTSLHYTPGSAATASSCAPELTLPFLKNDLWDQSGEALMDDRCNSWYAATELHSPNCLPFTSEMVMASQAYAFSSIIGS